MHSFISRIAFSAADLSSASGTPATVDTASPPATGIIPDVKLPAGRSNVAVKPAIKRAVRKPALSAKPAGKPAKPGKPASKPVAAATPDKRTEAAERIAADRNAVSALYAHFDANRDSVPVKPLSAFKPEASTAHPITRNPSRRQAAAIAVAFAAASGKLTDGGKAPRVFERGNVRVCIENGVLRDAISSGLITVAGGSPEAEILTLKRGAAATIAGLLGAAALKAGKLTAPKA